MTAGKGRRRLVQLEPVLNRDLGRAGRGLTVFARRKVDATGAADNALARAPGGRPSSINWTQTVGPAKKFDTTGGIQRSSVWLFDGRGEEQCFTMQDGSFAMAGGFGVASRNPAADGDFRRKQATEQADGGGNGVVNASGDAAAKPPDFQALKNCHEFTGTTLQSCHGDFRSLIRALSRTATNFQRLDGVGNSSVAQGPGRSEVR